MGIKKKQRKKEKKLKDSRKILKFDVITCISFFWPGKEKESPHLSSELGGPMPSRSSRCKSTRRTGTSDRASGAGSIFGRAGFCLAEEGF